MKCPSEYTCSVFAEGELPEGEAREVAEHLESCVSCKRLVAALHGESRVLVQCLQDADLDEAVALSDFSSAPQGVSISRLAAWVVGAAVAFRLSTGILFGFGLPPELAWLDPRGWALNLGIIDAIAYAIENGPLAVSGAVETAVGILLAMAVFVGMTRLVRRSAAISMVFGVTLAVGLLSAPSYAIDIRKGAAASLPAGETVDDSLLATPDGPNRNINIGGTVKGDLLAVGDLVTVSGTVEGNVIAAARRVEISGTVGGSLLTAAQTIVISGQVGRNLAGFAGNINIAKPADIAGNTATFSGESVIEGTTQRDLFAFSGMLDLRGNVGRNVSFRGGQVGLSAPAHIGGDFRAYVDRQENVRVDSGAVIAGNRDIRVIPRGQGQSRYFTVRFYIWQIVWVLAAFVTGLVLFWLFPWLAAGTLATGKDWLKAGGIGFVLLVTVPIAAIIVGITIIGLPIALLSFALWIAGLYIAKIIVAEFVGRSVMKSTGAVPLLAGLLLVIVAVDLPWIGGLINFLLCLLGLGAIAMTVYRRVTSREVVAPVAS